MCIVVIVACLVGLLMYSAGIEACRFFQYTCLFHFLLIVSYMASSHERCKHRKRKFMQISVRFIRGHTIGFVRAKYVSSDCMGERVSPPWIKKAHVLACFATSRP